LSEEEGVELEGLTEAGWRMTMEMNAVRASWDRRRHRRPRRHRVPAGLAFGAELETPGVPGASSEG
jgi:hypothetical protein